MGSLSGCAKKFKVDQAEIRELAKEYTSDGHSGPEAIKLVVKDQLKQMREERDHIIEQIRAGIGDAPQPSVAQAPVKVVKTNAKIQQKVNPANDSILTAISKSGGLNIAQGTQEWGKMVRDDLKAMNAVVRRETGLFGHVFHKDGLPLDVMRGMLEDMGYLPENSTLTDLEAAVFDSARGKPVYAVAKGMDAEIEDEAAEWAARFEPTDEDLDKASYEDFTEEGQELWTLLHSKEVDEIIEAVYKEQRPLTDTEFQQLAEETAASLWREHEARSGQKDSGVEGQTGPTGIGGGGEVRAADDQAADRQDLPVESETGQKEIPSLDEFERMLDEVAGQVTAPLSEKTDDAGGWEQDVAVKGAKKNPTIGGVQKQGGKRTSTSDLMDAFIEAFQDSGTYPAGFEGEGTGGKERDRLANNALTEWDRAISMYFAQKKGRQNDIGKDYFATPEPLGLKMVEWAEIRPGDSVLEPSLGHGAIGRWFPEDAKRRGIEPSLELASRAALVFDGDIVQGTFENHNIVNKYDAIIMNPPFGSAGRTAIDHLAKAAKHLKDNGRIVALIPRGSADQKFEKWLYEEAVTHVEPIGQLHGKPVYAGDKAEYSPPPSDMRRLGLTGPVEATITKAIGINEGFYVKLKNGQQFGVPPWMLSDLESTGKREKKVPNDMHLRADYNLPRVVFERAGTQVAARIVILDKNPAGHKASRDWTDIENIKDFFDHIQDATVPERLRPAPEEDPAPPAKGLLSGRGAKLPSAGEVKAQKEDITTGQFEHTKTGKPIFVATINNKLSDAEYKAASTLAKKNGGHYSGFNGAGAIRGFHFDSAEKRDAFTADLANGEKPASSEAGGETLYDITSIPALAAKSLQDLYKAIAGSKAAQDARVHLEEAAARIYNQGKQTYGEWVKGMKAFLMDQWERFKGGMVKLYQTAKKGGGDLFNIVNNERGSFSTNSTAAAAQGPRFQSSSEEVQQRRDAAHGLDKGPGLLDRLRDLMDRAKRETQHFPELDMKRDAQTADILRVFESSREAAATKAVAYIRSITKNLSAAEMDLFEWRVLLDDLAEEAAKGHKLPFGYTPEVLADDHQRVTELTEQNEKIQAAIARRQELQRKMVKDLVDAGLLPESVMENTTYFRHMVLEYANAKKWAGLSSKDLRNKKRGWQKGRQGSELDINTNFLEAEFEVYSQQLKELATTEALDRVEELNDISQKLKAQARAQNFEKLVGGPDVVRRIRRLEADAAELRGSREADDRARLAEINQELDQLDPTRPFKRSMAIGFSKLEALARSGALPQGRLRGMAEALANGEPNGKLFNYISELAGGESAGNLPARQILKAIANLDKLYRLSLGENCLEYRRKIDQRLIPEGYAEWQPEQGNAFYRQSTLPEQLVDRAIEATWSVQELIDSGLLKESVVMGGKKRAIIIPEGVAHTLDNLRFERDTAVLDTINKKMVGAWKIWTLLSPRRVIKYNLNNMSGDLDAAIAADPRILLHLKKAWSAALKRRKGELTDFDKEMIDRGVISSGISINEIPDISELPMFKGLTKEQRHEKLWTAIRKGDLSAIFPHNLVTRYFDWVSDLTNFREALLREAAYRRALELLEQGKPFMWASKPGEIAAIPDRKDRAAKLSRELIGDYGNLSAHGERIRARYIAFWSWMEINAPRYMWIFKNAAANGGKYSAGARIAGVAGKKFIGTSAGVIEKLVLTQALFALVTLFNRLFHGADDDDLDRNQLHVVLGRDSVGNIVSVRFQGAFSDALSWFGLEDYPEIYKKMRDGSMDAWDLGRKMSMAIPNKVFNAALPFVKLAGETIAGKTIYPDILKPRLVRDRAEHVARFFSLENEYRAAAGKPSRGYLNSLKQIIFYNTDPGEQAYFNIKEQAFKWMEKMGKDMPSAEPTARGNALYYYKQALRFDDEEAAAKYLERYKELGGKHVGINSSIKRSAPLASIPLHERSKFRRSLSDADKRILDRATEWYRNVYRP